MIIIAFNHNFMCLATTANNDFEAPSIPTITFPPDSVILTEMCVQYQIVNDVYKEFNETLTITVVPEHSFDNIDGPSEVSVTIIDDMDCKSQIQSCSSTQFIIMMCKHHICIMHTFFQQ